MPEDIGASKEETVLKTFNTAKVYAEEIIFPMMRDYKKFQRQANFGSDIMKDALSLSEEFREIQRFNGLKAMTETCYDLLMAISSTVRLKGNKAENNMMGEMFLTLDKLKELFYKHRERFFVSSFKGMDITELLDRDYFESVKKMIEICYVNVEVLMTRNKLLFADAKEDYMKDEEIKAHIMREYVEG